MATITVKNIPDDIYASIKEQAKNEHRSLNSFLIHLLATTSRKSPTLSEERPTIDLLERMRGLRDRMKAQTQDSVEILRQMRDEGEMSDQSR